MKPLLLSFFLIFLCLFSFSQKDSIHFTSQQYQNIIDSINNSFHYQYGTIQLNNGIATLHTPVGYKFLDAKQSEYILNKLWGNPPSKVLGLLIPKNNNPLDDSLNYVVEITYSEEGYIKDNNTENIDYEKLLEEMKENTQKLNPERKKQGYPAIEIIKWATPPYYDKKNNKLHWAKELKFDNYKTNTLNYNIRILGRKGFFNLNAIGDIDILPKFQQNANNIITSIEFNKGYKYNEFNPEADKIAAYGINGLIVGKALPKKDIFESITKFWKVILIGAIGIIVTLKKDIFSSKK